MKNRWLIALSAVGIHISIGSVYAWSVFNLPLENAFGWTKGDVAITFSLAIFFLGMSAAVMGRFVERRRRPFPGDLVQSVRDQPGHPPHGIFVEDQIADER